MRNPALHTTPESVVAPRVVPAIDFRDSFAPPRPTAKSKVADDSVEEVPMVPADTGKPKAGGIKFDQGKPMMSLLDSKFLEGTARVLTFGAQKYAPNNWRLGMPYSRLYDALQRHLVAFNSGEDLDPESNVSHLYHAACCLMFLSNMHETRPDLDDRWKENS